MSSSRRFTQWSRLAALALGLAAPAAAQDPDRSSGVYNFPNTPSVRSGVVQKVDPASPKPDIVVGDLTMNGVPVASSLTISSDQSGWTAGGKCLFNLGYQLKNAGAAATQSIARTFATEVTIVGPAPSSKSEAGFALIPGQVKSGQAQVWLVPGLQTATVFADPSDAIAESSESNNQRAVRVTLTGKCDGKNPALKPIEHQGYGVPDTKGERSGIIINDKPGTRTTPSIAAEGGDPSKQAVPSRNLVGSSAHDTDVVSPKPGGKMATPTVLRSDLVIKNLRVAGKVWPELVSTMYFDSKTSAAGTKNGRCLLDVACDLANSGAAPTPAFKAVAEVANAYLVTSTVHQSTGLVGGAKETVQATMLFASGQNTLEIVADKANTVSEGNEGNNVKQVAVVVIGGCQSAGLQGLPGGQ